MKSILTIGSAVYDVFIHLAHPIQGTHEGQASIELLEGKKMEVAAVSHYSGGGSTNSAVSFKRLGLDVTCFFKVGADDAGYFILNEVSDEKIDVDRSIITDQQYTGTSYIVQSPSGNHSVLVDRGANLTLQESELPLDIMGKFNYLYVTSLSAGTGKLLPNIIRAAQKAGVPLATNPGTSQLQGDAHTLKENLAGVSILILNAYEASLLFRAIEVGADGVGDGNGVGVGSAHPEERVSASRRTEGSALYKKWTTIENQPLTIADYFQKILSLGVKIAVVTNGAEGVYVATENAQYFHPSIKTEVVNTVGAGDAFASCFVGMIAQGESIENAIRGGIINSSSVLHYLGAKTGLLTKEELQQRLAVFDTGLLKKIV